MQVPISGVSSSNTPDEEYKPSRVRPIPEESLIKLPAQCCTWCCVCNVDPCEHVFAAA